MNGKCFKKNLNCIFQNEVTIWFRFDVQQSCRAHQDLSCSSKEFINLLDIFKVKSKITILIKKIYET